MSKIVVVHGTPGSGKTTHASKFKETYPNSVEHISIGNRLRDIKLGIIKSTFKRDVDQQAETLAQSAPLKHEVVNGVVFEFIQECPSTTIVFVDGYPRFLEQLPLFFESLKSTNNEYIGIINLFISKDTCVERLTKRGTRGGEKQVDPSFAIWRFNEYHTHTVPTIVKLRENSSTSNVNAEYSLPVVWENFHSVAYQLIFNTSKP